jgi:ATP-binding cassette subfamily F protein 3
VLGNASARSEERAPAPKAPVRPQKDMRREAAQRREALAPLRKKIKDRETLLEKLRKEIERIDRELAAPELYKDPDDATRLAKQRAERAHEAARAESEWLDLSAELEARESEAALEPFRL